MVSRRGALDKRRASPSRVDQHALPGVPGRRANGQSSGRRRRDLFEDQLLHIGSLPPLTTGLMNLANNQVVFEVYS